MDKTFEAFLGGLLLGALLASLATHALTYTVLQKEWKQEAIKFGYAEYNQTTGQWQWKQPAEASDE